MWRDSLGQPYGASWTDTLARPIHGSWVRTTDATSEPLDVSQAEEWLHDASLEEQSTISALVKAARYKVEDDTGLALLPQTWTQRLDRISAGRQITLGVGPVSSVTSITAYSPTDSSSVVSASVYRVDTASMPARVVLRDGQSWPSDVRPQDSFEIVFVAGYATIDAVPAPLVLAMRLLVDHWFHYRGVVGEAGQVGGALAESYQALISPYKLRVIM